MCRECGGRCCQSYPGTAWPQDFGKDLLEGLKKAFVSGLWQVDWWEGKLDGTEDPYFVRPAVKKDDRLRVGLWSGECIFLEPTGCRLTWKERPMQCKALVPDLEKGCDTGKAYDKKAGARAWIPYQEIILEAMSYAESKKVS